MIFIKNKVLMRKFVLLLIVSALLPLAVVAQPKLCGNVIDASGWSGNIYTDPYGIYSFDVSDASLGLTQVAKSRSLNGNGGGVADNSDVYLYCDLDISDDYAYASIYKYPQTDIDYGSRCGTVGSLYQVPTALTWDASTNNYYGCFYDKDNAGFEFGVASLASGRPSRTKLGVLKERLVAMADNDKGVLYGIGVSGKLYGINPDNGALTEIGNTGVTPADMIQSACYVDGTIYWAAQLGKRSSALYKISPSTGEAVKVGDFPNGEQFSVLYPFKAAAEDGAPAKIEDMTANFEGPSLTGRVSFSLPVKTFAGGELTGELTWTLEKDGKTLATGKAEAGTEVTSPDITLENTLNTLEVYTINGVGKSPVYKQTFFVGPDTPNSIDWGSATLSVDDNNKASVTWNPVTSGVNGGYFVPEEVTYNVVRMPGEITVATNIKEAKFSEQLPETSGIVTYYYSITPVFMGNEGYGSETNKVNVGSGYEVPFIEEFNDEGALDQWTVLDLNNDYSTWCQNSGHVYSQAGYDGGSNDWLISPSIHLVPGRYYKVSFKYWAGLPEYTEYAGSSFEVGFGKGTDPAAFQMLGSKSGVILSEENAKMFTAVVKADEEGQYNFGIHDVSPSDAYLLYVDDFSVAEGGTLEVPAPISDFTAVADNGGNLRVDISFTAPSATAEGKPLNGLQKIEIVRDEKDVVKTFDSPEAGKKYSFTDTEATGLTDGSHHYAVHSTNAKGQSLDAEADVKVGISAPGATTDLKAEEKEDGIHLAWTAPATDADGSAIDPENLTYTIAAVKYLTSEVVVVADDVKGTSYVDDKTFADVDDQLQVYYLVQAKNRAGVGQVAESNQFVVGTPYTLPMTENFSPEYERMSKYLWWIDITQDINTMSFFRFGTGMSSDGDNGCTAFYGSDGAFSNLRSGKISFSGVSKPTISYDYYMDYDGEAKLSVEYSADLKTWTELDCLDLGTVQVEEGGWRTHSLDASPCAAYPYVYVRFHGECTDGYTPLVVDNVVIKDSSESSISNVALSEDQPSDIYSVSGQLVRRDATTVKGLAPGMYIINGKKVFVAK